MQCISSAFQLQATSNTCIDAAVFSEEDRQVCDAPHVRYAMGNTPSGTCLGSGSYGTVRTLIAARMLHSNV